MKKEQTEPFKEESQEESRSGCLRLLGGTVVGVMAGKKTFDYIRNLSKENLNRQGYRIDRWKDCTGPSWNQECYTSSIIVQYNEHPSASQTHAELQYHSGLISGVGLALLATYLVGSAIGLGLKKTVKNTQSLVDRIL